MEVLFLNSDHAQAYDTFVTNHNGSFLQSWQWGELQKQNGSKIFRYAVTDSDNFVLTASFVEQTIPHLPGKYLYCAYGPVGDPEQINHLLNYLKQTYHKDYWFIRCEPQKQFDLRGSNTLRVQPTRTLITDLEQTEEELLSNMHPKTRYNIKVAQKHGVQIKSLKNPSEAEANQIIELLEQTSKRHGYQDHSKQYYQNLLSHHNEDSLNIVCYTASHENNILAATVMVDFGTTRTYLFGASSSAHKNLMAPYLLHWQAMLDAKTAGIIQYDWWGLETSSGKQAGFARFKQNFGGQERSYPPAIDLIYNRPWYTIYKVLRKLNRIF